MGEYSKPLTVDWNAAATTSSARGMEASDVAFQPIAELGTGRVTAFEVLCRFPGEMGRVRDERFGDAPKAGLHSEFELAVIARVIEAVRAFPDGVALAIKASPPTLASGWLREAIARFPQEQIIIHLSGDLPRDTDALLEQALLLQFRGVRIAMNVPGPAHSGLRQILRTRPDLVKIDRQLISGIGTDAAKRSIVAGHVALAREIGAGAVGEGIETRRELATARAMGLHLGQGWVIGRPVDFSTALAQLSLVRYVGVA